jgi:hypothetical protein
MTSYATKVAPEVSTVKEPVNTAGIVSPTEDEIAKVAYQLWLDSGCPIGSDQEHWFRAEAMLKNALAAKYADLSRRPSNPRRDTRTEFETVAEFTLERWEGHWEVWEREWPCARWVWDLPKSAVRVPRAAVTRQAAHAGG